MHEMSHRSLFIVCANIRFSGRLHTEQQRFFHQGTYWPSWVAISWQLKRRDISELNKQTNDGKNNIERVARCAVCTWNWTRHMRSIQCAIGANCIKLSSCWDTISVVCFFLVLSSILFYCARFISRLYLKFVRSTDVWSGIERMGKQSGWESKEGRPVKRLKLETCDHK